MLMNVNPSLTLALCAALAPGLDAQSPAATLSLREPTVLEAEDLRRVVKGFLECWYLRRDEPCFWSHVASAAPIRRYTEAFSGAFHDNPDPATLRLSAEDAPEVLRDRGLAPCLNDPASDGFCVLSALNYLRLETNSEPGEARFEEQVSRAVRAGFLPSAGDFVIVYYVVEGQGYNNEGMDLVWVPEAGTWRLFSLRGFD